MKNLDSLNDLINHIIASYKWRNNLWALGMPMTSLLNTQGPTNCMFRYPGDTKKCRRATRYFAWVFRRDTRPGTGY